MLIEFVSGSSPEGFLKLLAPVSRIGKVQHGWTCRPPLPPPTLVAVLSDTSCLKHRNLSPSVHRSNLHPTPLWTHTGASLSQLIRRSNRRQDQSRPGVATTSNQTLRSSSSRRSTNSRCQEEELTRLRTSTTPMPIPDHFTVCSGAVGAECSCCKALQRN